jgi:hypothetical protein
MASLHLIDFVGRRVMLTSELASSLAGSHLAAVGRCTGVVTSLDVDSHVACVSFDAIPLEIPVAVLALRLCDRIPHFAVPLPFFDPACAADASLLAEVATVLQAGAGAFPANVVNAAVRCAAPMTHLAAGLPESMREALEQGVANQVARIGEHTQLFPGLSCCWCFGCVVLFFLVFFLVFSPPSHTPLRIKQNFGRMVENQHQHQQRSCASSLVLQVLGERRHERYGAAAERHSV